MGVKKSAPFTSIKLKLENASFVLNRTKRVRITDYINER